MAENTKKIICFVCAQETLNLESWKEHIYSCHEEGIEYLKCPECQIPCRDIISHYKVHHRNLEIPKLEKYKVDKIFDWQMTYAKEQRKKPKWKEGVFDSIKMGKKIHYRSSWERDVMMCLEKCADIKEYYGDDHLCINYNFRGQMHKYWPDFTVKMNNNEIYVLEIKPMNQTELEINQAKWKFALNYCNQKQWVFQVWTQNYIRKIKTRAIRNDILLKEDVIPTQEEIVKELNFDNELNTITLH